MSRPDLDAIEALAATTTRTFTYDDGITDDSHEPPERGKPMAIYTDTGDWVADFDTGMLPNEELDTIGRLLVGAANALPALVAYARELEAMVARAGTFHVRPPSIDNLRPVTVERVKQLDGSELWAVRNTGDVLSCRGVWEYEPIPSERTPEFLSEFRFDTFDAAWSAALRADAAMRAASVPA